MKKIATTLMPFIVCLFFAANSTAQTQSWGQIGAEWHYTHPSSGILNLWDYEQFRIEKDTLVRGK
ncbi:MAG: hypothetical protein JXA77_14560 [Bacteroidales bacterium]|nr:hypothetical protein [Bacteroidales bacterium]MBN2818833.1 hypothetical protein [Bacteroidales bacterium]